MTGLELLFNTEQQSAFMRLPSKMAFKDAMAIYGRKDQATNDFLQKCIRVGILRKLAKGIYEKLEASGVTGVTV